MANVTAHGQKTVAFLSHAQMLWLLALLAFPPWAPPSASQVKFRCPLGGGKNTYGHSVTHSKSTANREN